LDDVHWGVKIVAKVVIVVKVEKCCREEDVDSVAKN
jgi:hypothetical protein